MAKRRNYSADFMARVALEALSGAYTVSRQPKSNSRLGSVLGVRSRPDMNCSEVAVNPIP